MQCSNIRITINNLRPSRDNSEHIITSPGFSFLLPPNIASFDNTHDNFHNVLVHWLDSVDSVTDRKLLILHSIGLSMNKIGKKTGLLRQTASRRYTNAIDALVWKLNHQTN